MFSYFTVHPSNFVTCQFSLVPRPSAIISVGGKDAINAKGLGTRLLSIVIISTGRVGNRVPCVRKSDRLPHLIP